MKKKIFILLLLSFCFLSARQPVKHVPVETQKSSFISTRETRPTEVIYHEDFENGLNGWTTHDGTLPRSMWHLDDFMTPDETGLSWWMGDSLIGGYHNRLIIYLETPEIAVPENSHLTFDLNWNCEEGVSDPPYDGWDGCFVSISEDSEESWDPIHGSPAYNSTNLYALTDHPGWVGSSEGWIDADFDLSDYEGMNIKIRFIFASDVAYCTEDDPEMFGMIVDNISLGDYVHNFDDGDEQGMTYGSLIPSSGDIWHIAEVGDAPSPTHAAVCQNEEGTYNINLENCLVSPSILLPEDSDEILVDFMIRGSFEDEDNFPEVDFFTWQISVEGSIWYYMSNPYGDPYLPNYVYTDLPEAWSSMVDTYSSTGNITEYRGMNVKFRIYFHSDEDEPIGEGIMIDDFKIYQIIYSGPAPEDLNAEIIDNDSVQLSWTDPTISEAGWIGWNNGEFAGSLGLTSAGEWAVADKFDWSDIEPYAGNYITKIKFYPNEQTANYTISIWSGNNASNLICEVPVQNPIIGDWNEIEIPEPILIEEYTTYWIGYQIDQTIDGTYPAGYDTGPSQNGLWANLGEWQNISSDFPFNWLINALVETPDGEVVVLDSSRNDRELLEYNIYNRCNIDIPYDLIDTIEAMDDPFYIHENPQPGYNYYVVTAQYDEGESEYSNEADAYILHENEEEYFHDDGTCESGFNVGITNNMVVKFTPESDNTLTLTYLKLFIRELNTGQVVIRLWDDDGENGLPGTILDQFICPVSILHSGWNLIEIPESYQLELSEGSLYIGIFENASLPQIGLDENSFGFSYTDMNGDWELLETGNIMIRAIGEYPAGIEEELISNTEFYLMNSPNPFSTGTTISFNLSRKDAENAKIEIYNIRGQKIRILDCLLECINSFDAKATKSLYSKTWDGKDGSGKPVKSGIYLYRLKSDILKSPVRKMILMRK